VLSVFASRHLLTIHGEDGLVLARWDPPDVSAAAVDAHGRVDHGLVAKQPKKARVYGDEVLLVPAWEYPWWP
jgi:hypothetical protein